MKVFTLFNMKNIKYNFRSYNAKLEKNQRKIKNR